MFLIYWTNNYQSVAFAIFSPEKIWPPPTYCSRLLPRSVFVSGIFWKFGKVDFQQLLESSTLYGCHRKSRIVQMVAVFLTGTARYNPLCKFVSADLASYDAFDST